MTLWTHTMFVWIYTSKQAICCGIVIGPKAEVLFITCRTLPDSSARQSRVNKYTLIMLNVSWQPALKVPDCIYSSGKSLKHIMMLVEK